MDSGIIIFICISICIISSVLSLAPPGSPPPHFQKHCTGVLRGAARHWPGHSWRSCARMWRGSCMYQSTNTASAPTPHTQSRCDLPRLLFADDTGLGDRLGDPETERWTEESSAVVDWTHRSQSRPLGSRDSPVSMLWLSWWSCVSPSSLR